MDSLRKTYVQGDGPMEAVPEIKECMNAACKCATTGEDFCGDFCGQVEADEHLAGCGCGHTSCDTTNLAFENQSLPITPAR
jgi:hypothetical protein